MPIEIRELKIKMTVDSGTSNAQPVDQNALKKLKAQIIEECIEVVSEMIQAQKER